MSVTVRMLMAALDSAFPRSWAEPWDNVGLLAGDPDAAVRGVFATLDATAQELAAAQSAGANVLLTHHPAFLEAPERLIPRPGPAALVHDAVAAGVALVACHTNLDRAPAGAASLPAALGLPPGEPVERGLQPMALVAVFVPPTAREAVSSAMHAAGAGRIGMYEGCSFTVDGIGRFTPGAQADPQVGSPGEPGQAAEERLEVVCPPAHAGGVVEVARRAHPYEEPLIVVTECAIARGAARLGRLSALEEPTTLADLARKAAGVFSVTPRVWGDPGSPVRSVATASGSAGGLLKDVCALGADALVAGEVRYHDALSASRSGLGIIELGHDVSEWPLVPVLAEAIRPVCEGVPVVVDSPRSAWWTP